MGTPEPNAFQIGIICPLPIEIAATQEVLDLEYDDPKERYPNDTNTYSLGRIGSHNVVIAGLPAGFTGVVAAATVASNLTKTFTSVKVLLCVGIGGGVWTETSDVRIGDVVVSEPAGGYGGIEQYNFGKAIEGGRFERTGVQRPPPEEILTAVNKLKTNLLREKTDINTTISRFQEKKIFRYLGAVHDRLFKTGSPHKTTSPDCTGCDISQLIERTSRESQFVDGLPVPKIHYGLIASADQLMKDSKLRDSLNISCGGHIRCFEMEAAGLMNSYPCLVIRGISDYCDSHKRTDKGWHGCAAAMAAAYARELIKVLPLNALLQASTLAEVVSKAGPIRVIPLPRNQNFIGRQFYINWLVSKLYTENKQESCVRVALCGLGGIGKTQIALEAAFRIQDKSPHCSVFWVRANDLTSFESSYREIGRRLQIPGFDDEKVNIKQLIKKALNEIQSPWLMIVDNADNSDILFKANETASQQELFAWLPNNYNGAMIFTTRDEKAATNYAETNVLVVEEMESLESKELLKKSVRKQSLLEDEPSTTRLLNLLCNIPLAIKQAAAYLNKNNTTVARYLNTYEKTDEDLIKSLSIDFEDQGRYRSMKNPIATTWLISFEQIREKDPLAAEYMAFMSCIENQDIPESLLPSSAPDQVLQSLGTLQAFAFINKHVQGESYDMHRLVHLVMQSWLKRNEEWNKWTQRTLYRVIRVYPWPEHENKAIWIAYHIHARRIFMLTERQQDLDKERAYLGSFLGESFNQLGKYVEAEIMHRQALQLMEAVLGKEHPATLTSMNNLAISLRQQGKYAEAEVMDRQTLQLRETVLGKEHPSTLTSMNNLAVSLHQQGKHAEAEVMDRQALQLRETVLGKEHPATLASMNSLAISLGQQGKYAEAEIMDRQTLQLRETVLGKEHPSTLGSMNNLAESLRGQGKYVEAEFMDRQTLQLRETVLGKEHPSTLTSMNNLAESLRGQGKYVEAEVMDRQTLQLRETVLGKEHPDTFTSMNNLANSLRQQGKYAEAEVMDRQTLQLRETVLGKEHPSTLGSMNNLAESLRGQGKYVEAEVMDRQTLQLRETVLGKEYPDTLASMNNLAISLSQQGKYAEAEVMDRQTLQLRETVLGKEHPSTLTSMNNLAESLRGQGKYVEAEVMDRQTLQLRERVLGKEHPSTLASMNNLAESLCQQVKYAEAEVIHRQTLQLRETVLGKEHPDTLASMSNLVISLGQQGKYTEAEVMHRQMPQLRERNARE